VLGLRVATNTKDTSLGEDQHTYNTDKTALPGIRRHDRYDGRANPFTSQYADELGWAIWLAMVVRGVNGNRILTPWRHLKS
jgi:hypothetical protein